MRISIPRNQREVIEFRRATEAKTTQLQATTAAMSISGTKYKIMQVSGVGTVQKSGRHATCVQGAGGAEGR